MKRIIPAMILLFVFSIPCRAAAVYQIEVLQVSRLNTFEEAYQGILKGLERNGLILGNDVKINRTIIDTNPEAELYTWENLRTLMKVKLMAGEIIDRKPRIVITIGTTATKFSRLKIVKAGIPLVFTCVEFPETVGCASKTLAGPGFTGVTMYVNPQDFIRTARLGLPNMKKLGIIHSDDDYAVAYMEETKKKAADLGIEVISRQLNLWERINPAAEEMLSQGIDTFFIPFDRYYRLNNFERGKTLGGILSEHGIPCISSMGKNVGSPLIYTFPDFAAMGNLTADQAAKILKEGVKPEDIPVAMPQGLTIFVDIEASRKLGIELPVQLLQIAKPDGKQPSEHKGG